MENDKAAFLKEGQFILLNTLAAETKPNWGLMNAQQMVEHLRDFFNISVEKIKVELMTPPEHLPKFSDFLYSDKQFRENTKAPAALLGDIPLPLRYASLPIAIEKLQKTVEGFWTFFENDEGKKTLHPVFGMLNFDEWIRLHYKHVTHHFRQFNLIERII